VPNSSPTFASPVGDVPAHTDGELVLTDLTAIGKTRFDAGRSGAPSPVTNGFAVRNAGGVAFSVAPGEWFQLTVDKDVASDAPDGVSAIDLTHVKAVFRLTGAYASSVLEKMCALDFGDRFMPDGSAARTSVAKTVCEVVRIDDGGSPSYLIAVSRSYGGYLFDALTDAAAEFNGAAGPWDGSSL